MAKSETALFQSFNIRYSPFDILVWSGVRVAEGTALEMRYAGNCIEGSNPSRSDNRLNFEIQSPKFEKAFQSVKRRRHDRLTRRVRRHEHRVAANHRSVMDSNQPTILDRVRADLERGAHWLARRRTTGTRIAGLVLAVVVLLACVSCLVGVGTIASWVFGK